MAKIQMYFNSDDDWSDFPTRSKPLPRSKRAIARLDKPVYHIGYQWAVTAFGIESACKSPYLIEKERLWEFEARNEKYSWSRHMAEKDWVDVADFNEAFQIARRVHAKHMSKSLRPKGGAR